jgi:hypothetical protein
MGIIEQSVKLMASELSSGGEEKELPIKTM